MVYQDSYYFTTLNPPNFYNAQVSRSCIRHQPSTRDNHSEYQADGWFCLALSHTLPPAFPRAEAETKEAWALSLNSFTKASPTATTQKWPTTGGTAVKTKTDRDVRGWPDPKNVSRRDLISRY